MCLQETQTAKVMYNYMCILHSWLAVAHAPERIP